jgi:hypothetical protein
VHTTLTDSAAPIRMWLDPAETEPGAMRQLRNCAELPCQRRRSGARQPGWSDCVGAAAGCIVGD